MLVKCSCAKSGKKYGHTVSGNKVIAYARPQTHPFSFKKQRSLDQKPTFIWRKVEHNSVVVTFKHFIDGAFWQRSKQRNVDIIYYLNHVLATNWNQAFLSSLRFFLPSSCLHKEIFLSYIYFPDDVSEIGKDSSLVTITISFFHLYIKSY